ncbi:dihydrodipicolinate synthase family protein [Kyrpidia spormannii]|uniref:Dihydrodipicolinate synthase family protein n=1 Tax=Kyrpidia spormannii TaxID=2055160 RepID=A0A6F9E032_9BACL|nr:dihydrodipicolinate synthase family protein [Kyrpidia spormannii]CAB3390188.1 conserved protein of unknown function [Kyrpidia spormannii]
MQADRQRERWMNHIFPGGFPALWCPPITHYREDGSLDVERIEGHLAWMSGWVSGFLVPGSTSDGWEMSEDEEDQWVDLALRVAEEKGLFLWIGVLRRRGDEAAARIRQWMDRLAPGGAEDLVKRRIAGFAVCPPRGPGVTQDRVYDDLRQVAETGAPLCFYQIPQVTQSRVEPETLGRLIEEFGNVLALKDSSGEDRCAASAEVRGHIRLMRGAEGDYLQWWAEAGGIYDGFLLSTANAFGEAYTRMFDAWRKGDKEAAQDLSRRLTAVMEKAFGLAQTLGVSNAFAAANKLIDHFYAHGPGAVKISGPRVRGGQQIPTLALEETGKVLREYGLLPERGYWAK